MKRNAMMRYLSALLLFGSNGVVASHIHLSSQWIVLLRTLLGSALLLGVFFLTGGKLTIFSHKRQGLFLLLSGAAMGASWMFLFEAYSCLGVSIASLLYYCGPVLVMALSPLLFREKLGVRPILGFLTVLCGVACINGNAFGGSDLSGVVWGLLSAVMYALMLVCSKKAKDIAGLENAALQLVFAFFTVAVIVGLKDGFAMDIPPESLLPLLILGLLNTGVGCYLYFSSVAGLPVQTVAVCGYIEPLSAVVFSVLFLNEHLRPLQVVGAALIIGGALFSELDKHRST